MHFSGAQTEVPSENECRPYIEKALHDLKVVDASDGNLTYKTISSIHIFKL